MPGAEVPKKAVAACAASSIAQLVTFPIDALRTNIVNTEHTLGTYQMIKQIIRQNGIRSLFKGFGPVMLKQMINSGIRLAGYDTIKAAYPINYNCDNPEGYSINFRLGAGMVAGGIATITTSKRTSEEIIVQAKTNISESIRRYRNYTQKIQKTMQRKSQLQTIKNITTSFINFVVLKNGFIAVAEVVSYDIMKDYLIEDYNFQDAFPTHFLSAVFCGCISFFASSPIAALRTQYIAAPPNRYRTVISCIFDILRTKGIPGFYPEFTLQLCRMLIFNIILWTSYEKLKSSYPRINENQSS